TDLRVLRSGDPRPRRSATRSGVRNRIRTVLRSVSPDGPRRDGARDASPHAGLAMKYFVKVGRETIEVELGTGQLLVDGTPVRAELSAINGTPIRLLKVDDSVQPIIVRPGDGPGRW